MCKSRVVPEIFLLRVAVKSKQQKATLALYSAWKNLTLNFDQNVGLILLSNKRPLLLFENAAMNISCCSIAVHITVL